MSKSKVDFIADLLAEKSLNSGDKERLFHLASKELKSLETTDERLLKKIEELEEKINGNNSNLNVIYEKNEDKSDKKLKFSHEPKNTVEFLRLFKYEDGSGFKELIHDIDFEAMPPEEILKKVTAHPNFIYAKHNNQKVVRFKPIHGPLQQNVMNLIKLFQNEGIKFIDEINKHPFEHHKEYTEYAKNFKKNYRFGSGTDYTQLAELILNIAKNEKYQNFIKPENIEFLPDRRKFDIRANFFSWVPSIKNGLYYFFDGVKDHGNISGEKYHPEDKVIKIECWKNPEDKSLFISFFDQGTIAKHSQEKVLQSLRNSPAYQSHKEGPHKGYFWSLCNWYVEADFEGSKSYHLKILEEKNEKAKNYDLIPMDKEVGGFKHILKFYDL